MASLMIPVVARFPDRPGLTIARQVVGALVLRELLTRFGKHRLGALWMLAEPMLGALIVILIVGTRHQLTGGVNSAGFVIAGLVSWRMVRNLFSNLQNAVDANQGLFVYRQVLPLSAMAARALLETGLSLMVYLGLLGIGAWWGLQVGCPRPLDLLGCWLLLTALGSGTGLLLAALQAVTPSTAKAANLALRPLMWVSGVFYATASLPRDWQEVVMWNPLLHAIELLRLQQFGDAYATPVSWSYPCAWALGLLATGLSAYRLTWRRMVAS